MTKKVASVLDKIIEIMGTEHFPQSIDLSIANVTSAIVQLLEQQIHHTVRHGKQLTFAGEHLAARATTVEKYHYVTSGLGFMIRTNKSLEDTSDIRFSEDTTLLTTLDMLDKDMEMNESMISITLPEEAFDADEGM